MKTNCVSDFGQLPALSPGNSSRRIRRRNNGGPGPARVKNCLCWLAGFLSVMLFAPAGLRGDILSGPFTNPSNAHVYLLLSPNTWTGAEAEAVSLGGHLATINDAAENAWIVSKFGDGSRHLWIGLSDARTEGDFKWVNGDTAAFRNWSSGEPNNYNGAEDYTEIYPNGLWNDLPASSSNCGVVEAVLGVPVFTTQLADQTVYLHNPVTLSVSATGWPTPAFQWYYENSPIPGATHATLTLTDIQNSNQGSYRVEARNPFGLAASLNANLTVKEALFPAQPEGFENGWDGWSTDDPAVWQVGVPTSGPGKAFSEMNLAATVLGGNYEDWQDSRLVSPQFLVPAADQNPRLRFWHWYQFSAEDFGEVQIQVQGATNGWQTLAHWEWTTSGGKWVRPWLDLGTYAGQTVRLALHFHSEDQYSNGADVDAGWYVDEMVLQTGPEAQLFADRAEGFEGSNQMDRWQVTGGTWQIGVPTSGPGKAFSGMNVAATVLNGSYDDWQNSRLVSPQFVVPAADQNPRLRFWQWYRFSASDFGEVQIQVQGATNGWETLARWEWTTSGGVWVRPSFDLRKYAGKAVRLAFYFYSADQYSNGADVDVGWYLDELVLQTGPEAQLFANGAEGFEGTNQMDRWQVSDGTWQIGVPTSGPGGAFSGTNLAATLLGGNYEDWQDSRLVSPQFLVPAADQNPRLRFWHWYQFSAEDFGEVQIQVQGATNGWQTLAHWEWTTSGGKWVRPWLDLGTYAGQTVRLALHFHSEDQYSNGADVDAGWYVDEMVLQTGPEAQLFADGAEGFEGSNQMDRWQVTGGTWQIGVPTSGPGKAFSGMNVAATVLNGSYDDWQNSRLVSPQFVVPAADQNPRLRFWQWYRFSASDFGEVQIQVQGATNGWETLARWEWTTSGGVWVRPSFDLRKYAGKAVRLAFYFYSADQYSNGADVDVGWYLDELVLQTGPEAQLSANGAEGFEGTNQMDRWQVSDGTWQIGVPTSGPGGAFSGTNLAATLLGGNYEDWQDSRLVSPQFLVPAADQNPRLRFWHWYQFSAEDFGEVQIQVQGATNGWQTLAHWEWTTSGGKWVRPWLDLGTYAGQTVRLALHFHSEDQYSNGADVDAGWYVDYIELKSGPEIFNNPESFELGWGDWWSDNSNVWEMGVPTSGPPVDKTGQRAFTGTSVTATLLGGNYPASSNSRLISPSFAVPSVTGDNLVTARFWQWYQYGTGDTGQVQISTWNGTAWSDWSTVLTAAAPGKSTNWTQVLLDLTAYQGQQARLAFYHTANADGSVGAGWYIDQVELSTFIPSPLNVGQLTTNRFTANGQAQYYVLSVPPGGHLRLNLNDADHQGVNEVYLRRGSLPSPGLYDARFKVNGAADQTVFAPDAGAGKWYVLVYNSSGALPGDYSLDAEFSTGVALESVTPSALGNSIPGTLDIRGAGFTPGTMVSLVSGATFYAPTDLGVVSSSQMLAEFDFTVMPVGNYSLQVAAGTNSSELPFTVVGGGEAKLATQIIVPKQVGYHAIATVWVEYSNTGQVAMLAPILEIGAQQNGRRAAILSLSDSRLVEGFWTSAMPEGFASSVQFLASGKTPGILQPGESGRVPVYYAGWQQPWDMGYSTIYWNLSVLGVDNTNDIDWSSLKDFMRPSTMTAEQWEPVYRNLMSQVGFRWGDYTRALDNNARYLAKLGENVTDIRDLLSFEVMQASGLGLTRTLASALDAQVQAPGLSISFTRSFSSDIPSRFRSGRFGRGWSDNWDYTLAVANDGTVTINGPSGSRRVFQPDSRGPNYFAQAADYATLSKGGADSYTLQEASGTVYTFNNGLLQSVQDTHSNRIVCGYSGIQLTRLTHSAGPWLEIVYSGGVVTSMRDSVGRQTTFGYDASGEHLAWARDYRGLTNSYAYDLTAGAPSQHALNDVGKPDGTRQIYTYDAQGRLASKSGCCGGGGLTTYAYDSTGKITATHCLTNTSSYWLDHRGRLVKSQNPLGNMTLRTYDALGQLVKVTDPAGRSRSYEYDDRGNLALETDALGYPTRYTYAGSFNRLATVLDANGNLTRYQYESDGDLSTIVNAASLAEGWTYDAQGNRLSWKNRRGQAIIYTNDSLGRVIARKYPDGTLHSFAYDAHGNLTSYSDATGITTQEFDAQDRLTQITYPAGYWLRYSYDAAGRRASMLDHLGHRTDYHYDEDARLQSLSDETGQEFVRYDYDLSGRMSRKILGNGVFTTYAYDAAGQLLDLFNHQTNGAVLSRFQYTYDNRGRRDTMTTTYGEGDPRTSLAGLWRYDYDDTGQLIGWTAPWGRRVDYKYDGLGNRLLVRDNGTNIAYNVNNLNQYTQVGSTLYHYDADGNLTNKVAPEGTTWFVWTPDNMMLEADGPNGAIQNTYAANAHRARRLANGISKTFALDLSAMGDVVGEFDSSGDLVAVYAHALGLVSRREADGRTVFYTFDAGGNTSEVIGDSDASSLSYSYMPFGERNFGSQTDGNPFHFVGEQGVMADEFGLSLMRARHYEQSLSRFISTDPLGIAAGDASLYRYVANRPTMATDPLGLDCNSGRSDGCDPGMKWGKVCGGRTGSICGRACVPCGPGDSTDDRNSGGGGWCKWFPWLPDCKKNPSPDPGPGHGNDPGSGSGSGPGKTVPIDCPLRVGKAV